MAVHIQFSPQEILEGKYLLSEAKILYFNAIKSQENYIKMKQKEMRLKLSLKTKFKILSSTLKFFQSTLPEIKSGDIEDAESESSAGKYSFIEQDLKDIQSNLKRITEKY